MNFGLLPLEFLTVPTDGPSKLKQLQEQVVAFFTEKDIGRGDDARRHWGLRFAHFWLLVVKSFIRNRCPVRASALAYTTLLALVPLLAVGVSISTSVLQQKGPEQVKEMIKGLIKQVPMLESESRHGNAEAAARQEQVVENITSFITKTRSVALGSTGTIALVFVAIGLLRTIEATFNDIWGVQSGRGWLASIVQYWAAISLGPIALLIVIGLTTSTHYTATADWIATWPLVGTLVFKFLPFLVLSLAFALLYQVMPNTPVQWQGSLVGGIVGGTLWQLNHELNVRYASKATTYGQIYGSLSIIPLFLVGMYFSWLILLFGAQVAYAYQNRQSYLQEKQAESVHQRGREFIALRIITLAAQRFATGQRPFGVNALAANLAVPSRLVSQLVGALIEAGLLVEVHTREGGHVPARPIETITVHQVLQALRNGRGMSLETSEDGWRNVVRNRFEEIAAAEKKTADALTLADLVREGPSRD